MAAGSIGGGARWLRLVAPLDMAYAMFAPGDNSGDDHGNETLTSTLTLSGLFDEQLFGLTPLVDLDGTGRWSFSFELIDK